MEKSVLFHEENAQLSRRFRQFFIGTQVAAFGGILNLAFFGNKLFDSENLLFFRFDLIAFVVGIGVTLLL